MFVYKMDWEKRYGRTGFHAGLGGVRPFGINEPTLNISKDDFDDLYPRNNIPQYYVQQIPNPRNPRRPKFPRLKQIVLWNDDYTRPLPLDEQKVTLRNDHRGLRIQQKVGTQRLEKRKYIKDKLDQEDPVLENKTHDTPRTNFGFNADSKFFKRKTRREALTNNPYTEFTREFQEMLPPTYDNQTLNKSQVRRGNFLNALKVMLYGGPELARIREEELAEEEAGEREPSRPASPGYTGQYSNDPHAFIPVRRQPPSRIQQLAALRASASLNR